MLVSTVELCVVWTKRDGGKEGSRTEQKGVEKGERKYKKKGR